MWYSFYTDRLDQVMISRRTFSLTLATPLLLRAQTKALQARIKIDSDRRIGAIDPKIYGNFAEHLGRCIEGGLFEAAARSTALLFDV